MNYYKTGSKHMVYKEQPVSY